MADGTESLRLFFALWPSETTRAALHPLAKQTARLCQGQAVPVENLHLTLAFLGATKRDKLAKLVKVEAAIHCMPFDFVLDRLFYWPKSQVIAAGMTQPPAQLLALVEQLQTWLTATGIHYDNKIPFVPHVTLARAKSCSQLPPSFAPVHWQADSWALVQSEQTPHGPRYRSLADWSFDEPTH